jgi:hypothetical protein
VHAWSNSVYVPFVANVLVIARRRLNGLKKIRRLTDKTGIKLEKLVVRGNEEVNEIIIKKKSKMH